MIRLLVPCVYLLALTLGLERLPTAFIISAPSPIPGEIAAGDLGFGSPVARLSNAPELLWSAHDRSSKKAPQWLQYRRAPGPGRPLYLSSDRGLRSFDVVASFAAIRPQSLPYHATAPPYGS